MHARYADTNVVINVVNHSEPFLIHYEPDGIAEALEDLTPVTCPEWDTGVDIVAFTG